MSPDAKKVLELGMALKEGDRAWVGQHLLESVRPAEPTMSREEWERAWMVEVERRWKAYESGEVEGIPSEEVVTRLKARFG